MMCSNISLFFRRGFSRSCSTVVASSTIGYHEKKVILYNMKGFWNGLIACLDDLHEKGVTRKQWRSYIRVANSLEELTALLKQ